MRRHLWVCLATAAWAMIMLGGVIEANGPAGAQPVLPSGQRVHPPGAAPASGTNCANGDYSTTSSTGASLVAGTSLLNGSQCDDCTAVLALPFSYTLYGQSFSSVNVSSNGNLQFNSNFGGSSDRCVPRSDFSYAILAQQQDLNLVNNAVCPSGICGVFTSVTGSSPHRIVNIEWRGVYYNTSTYVNFEVCLYEGATYLEMIYGAVPSSGSEAAVGVQSDLGSRYTIYECSTGGLSTGLRVSFNLVCPPTPTQTPTSTPTIVPSTPTTMPTNTPANTPTITPTVCGIGTPLSEGFESGTLNTFHSVCSETGCGWSAATGNGHIGAYAAFAPDLSVVSDQQLTQNTAIIIPVSATAASLTFWHRYGFEACCDAGVLERSTDGGATWADIGAANISAGGYNGTVAAPSNPLVGRQAWTGTLAAYAQVAVNLLSYAGTNLLLRFREGTDASLGNAGWYIDDIAVSVTAGCGQAITPTIPPTDPPLVTTTATVTLTTPPTETPPTPPTGTSTPTSTPGAPSATPTICLNVLNGHLSFQGLPQPGADNAQTLTLHLQPLGGGPLASYTATTDAGGNFSVNLSGLAPGAYTWWLKAPRYLARTGTLAGGCAVTQDFGQQPAGDLDNSNCVDITDFSLLRATFSKTCGDAGYDGRADYNGDCLVDVTDFSLLRGNFGACGPPAP